MPHPTLPAAQPAAVRRLRAFARSRSLPPPPREAIEGAVARVFGIAADDLRRRSRGRAKVALARQVAMYLAHVGCGMSLTQTGRTFGRDRTTVAHACTVIEDRRDDPLFDRALDLLEWAIPSLASRRISI
jgi:chromosomal replication initiation ATPase DnaA